MSNNSKLTKSHNDGFSESVHQFRTRLGINVSDEIMTSAHDRFITTQTSTILITLNRSVGGDSVDIYYTRSSNNQKTTRARYFADLLKKLQNTIPTKLEFESDNKQLPTNHNDCALVYIAFRVLLERQLLPSYRMADLNELSEIQTQAALFLLDIFPNTVMLHAAMDKNHISRLKRFGRIAINHT